ncbi:Protein of unknown function [Gryllus bimaculatus]|nr:Protein of unknown function [Gryllus bimaculatus]
MPVLSVFTSPGFREALPLRGRERPAAMQTGSAGLSNSSLNVVMLIVLCLLYSALLENAQLNDAALLDARVCER